MNFIPVSATDDSAVAVVVRDVADQIDTCGCNAQVNLDFGPGLTNALIKHEAGCDWLTTASFGESVLVVVHRRQHEGDEA